ncbi:MAG: tRNA pseudouridine(13) synthase TruD [Gemmataceae bacterium]|nr:tRNA pseudouridine(13) synthase TruD [Gemmataceae bacterium]GIW84440.1 MAG: tRNA pseudouridine synthase D [Gemmataceae bacterium]
MKLRQKPEDFQVEEITDVVPGNTGEFAFYKLVKTGWTTPDALAIIRRKWNIHHRRISYGGLKDRHAITSQYFSIFRGPPQDLEHLRFQVKYLGQLVEPYTSTNIRSNRFTVVMRDMSLREAETAAQVADSEVAAIGYPNYFDDQRFGSVGEESAFIAKYMLQANWEGALWQALAAPYEYDRAADKRLKQLLRTHWGQWTSLRELLPRSHARSLVCYLADHPQDYKGAVARLRPELKGLYVAAYQSWLWNQTLAVWLKQSVAASDLVTLRTKHGDWPAPRRVPDSLLSHWTAGRLPLPCSRLKPHGHEWWLPLLQQVLHHEGLTLERLKIPGLDRPFFPKGERAVSVRPTQLRWNIADDELQCGQVKLVLEFELPRGCYATMLVKRLMAGVSTPGTPRK